MDVRTRNEAKEEKLKSSVIEIIALLAFAALGVLGMIEAGQIAGMSFDPLGSKAAPYAISALVVVLSAICAFRLLTGRATGDTNPESVSDAGPEFFPLSDLAEVVGVLGLTVLYVVGLFNLGIPFSIATVIFVSAVAVLISRKVTARGLALAGAVGAFVGFGGEYLFTQVFFVDLPTMW